MRKKERYEKVIAWFQDNVPVAETELHYNNPYELLIAVILSAQCTDKRVNIITPPLYKDFRLRKRWQPLRRKLFSNIYEAYPIRTTKPNIWLVWQRCW